MISSLLLLSAGVFATPVFISEVKATREAGHLRVEVLGDAGIDPEGARTKIDDGLLLIYLGGTRVRADNRAWDLAEGTGEIRAHRHKTETELVVPLSGNGCAGPVELTGTKNGITALVGCDGTVASPRPARVSPVEKSKAISVRQVDKLKALIEIPPAAEPEAKAIPSGQKLAAIAEPAKPRVASALSEAPKPRVAAAVADSSKPRVAAAGTVLDPLVSGRADRSASATTTKGATTATATAATGAAAGAGLRAVALPALLLGVLALVAYLFARRRRASTPRQIEILETASLGPKRSLIVARVGDETLILGSSEAGITLLRGNPGAAAALTAPGSAAAITAPAEPEADGSIEISQPIEEALADIPEPQAPRMTTRGGFRTIEGGLAGLFSKRGGALVADGAKADEPERFEDLLEDSVEDQELRRKLAAGMSARVR